MSNIWFSYLFHKKIMSNLFLLNNLKTGLHLIKILTSVRCHHKSGCSINKKDTTCTGKLPPLLDINCKVALITGGAEGVGLGIAHEILSEQAQHVALIGLDVCKGRESVNILNNAYGKNKAIFLNCDVQSKVQVTDCYEKVIQEFGKIDIVVNAAGIFDGCNWEKEIMTNLVGTINNMLEAYKFMNKGNPGCGYTILNFGGLYGLRPLYVAPTLSAVQHGIVGLSRSFGDEKNFQKTGVRVVCLCPGITNTNFIKNAHKKALNEYMGQHMEALFCKVKRQNPDVCAKSALHLLKFGPTGSVWVVEGSKLYSLHIPDWKKYRKLESQLL